MAKKRYKKRRHNAAVTAKRQAEQEKIADEIDRNRKRMDPVARTLLLGDLVFLAVFWLLEKNEVVSAEISLLSTIVGLILLIIALWFQFGKKKNGGGKSTL